MSSVLAVPQTIVTMTTDKPVGQSMRIEVEWSGSGTITANGETLTNGVNTSVIVPSNQTIELVASDDAQLTLLNCPQNELTTLRIANSSELTVLGCSDNQLIDLDLTQCPALTWLDCYNNQLALLNVLNCPALTFLECFNNRLSALNLTNNPVLRTLLCNNNRLTDLNVTNCLELVWMVASNQTIMLPTTPAFSTELSIENPVIYNGEVVTNISSATAANGEITWSGLIGSAGTSGCGFTTNLPAGTDGNSQAFSGTVIQPWVIGEPSDYFDGQQTIVAMTTSKSAGETVQVWVDWSGYGMIMANGSILKKGSVASPLITVPENQTIELVAFGDIQLTSLKCFDNQLIALDLISCSALEELNCRDNQLSSLNLSNCSALAALDCPNNQLTALNITSCPDLFWLTCGNNRLASLDVSRSPKLTFLECFFNQLVKLDVTNCPKLITLLCNNNRLTSLDVTNCPALVWMVASNQIVTLPIVSAFTDELSINNPIAYNKNLVTGVTGATVLNGKITWTDLIGDAGTVACGFTTNLPAGTDGNSQPFSGVVIQPWSLCTVLADCFDRQQTIVTMTTNKSAGETVQIWIDWIGDGLITANGSILKKELAPSFHITVPASQTIELVAYGDLRLTMLKCDNNQLTTLNVTNGLSLLEFSCANNQLSTLTVPNSLVLETLDCSNNQLTVLNIVNCPVLVSLKCSNNQLTALDLNRCPALESFNCSENNFSILNVSNRPTLTSLSCYNNQLVELNVTNCPALTELIAFGQTIALPGTASAFEGELSIDNPILYNGGEVTNVAGATADNGKINWIGLTGDSGDASYSFTADLPAGVGGSSFSGTVTTDWVLIPSPCRYQFHEIVNVKWNNTLMVKLGKLQEDGYALDYCRWFLGETQLEETSATYSAGPEATDYLSSTESYRLELVMTDGRVISTCESEVLQLSLLGVSAYPNPVNKLQVLTVDANVPSNLLDGATIVVISTQGNQISSTAVTGSQTAVQMPGVSGTYVVRFDGRDGFRREMKVIVK